MLSVELDIENDADKEDVDNNCSIRGKKTCWKLSKAGVSSLQCRLYGDVSGVFRLGARVGMACVGRMRPTGHKFDMPDLRECSGWLL